MGQKVPVPSGSPPVLLAGGRPGERRRLSKTMATDPGGPADPGETTPAKVSQRGRILQAGKEFLCTNFMSPKQKRGEDKALNNGQVMFTLIYTQTVTKSTPGDPLCQGPFPGPPKLGTPEGGPRNVSGATPQRVQPRGAPSGLGCKVSSRLTQ